MSWIIARLREPSTYAGIAALLGAFGLTFDDSFVQAFSAFGVAAGGLLAVILGDKGKDTPAE